MANMQKMERDYQRSAPERRKRREMHVANMRIACSIAKRSKCCRAQYGALILRADGSVASMGFNGKPRGSCCDGVCFRDGLPPGAPGPDCCLHAESNAIDLGNYLDRQGGTFYVNGLPCSNCALRVMQSGVAELVCLDSGQHGYEGLETLTRYGAKLNIVVLTSAEVNSNSLILS